MEVIDMAKSQHGRDLTGTEMGELLDEFSNGAGRKEIEDFANYVTSGTHRTLQQKMMRMFVACIERWAAAPTHDQRNEATVQLCKKICEATGDKHDRHLPTI